MLNFYKTALFIPRGIAYDFLTINDNVEFQYKYDNLYNREAEGGIYCNKPKIVLIGSITSNIMSTLSKEDKIFSANFIYKEDL